ncbi:MAG: hypothetical protein SOZ00_04305 [Tidjanibacter sp.]|nr:hypothetical protein [Tidjanibacter sp.]
MKSKFWLIIVLAFALSSASCKRECDCKVLTDSEYSGFGYAASLNSASAEVLFTVESESDSSADIVVRCRAVSPLDITACTLRLDQYSLRLEITEAGTWVEVPLTVNLKRGVNHISIVGAESIVDDILIDYLEIE